MTKFDHMKLYAPAFLRIGISLVFLWFGTQQLTNVQAWVGLIPRSILDISHLTAVTLVHFNGAFEIVFGLALLCGFFTRITALILALHMLSIMSAVGYNAIGVRDFGLFMATFSIFLYGMDNYSLDAKLEKKIV
jgi:uncharacterized membrane protein YphA (DoxX/SURF4 family)